MIKAYFMDNQTVGADELNGMVHMLAGSGVADPFTDGVPYNVSKLNDVYYATLSAGAVPESDGSLRVDFSNGRAYVAPGTAIFPDGTYAVVSADSGVRESAAVTAGAEQYIYLKSDRVNNAVSLLAASSMPTQSDNAVVLAKIAADGTVTDLRTYAKGKLPTMYASDAGLAGRLEFTIRTDTDSVTFNTNSTPYRHMFVRSECEYGPDAKCQTLAWVDLNTMQAFSAYSRSDDEDNDYSRTYANKNGVFVVSQRAGLSSRDLRVMGKLSVSNGTYTISLTHDNRDTWLSAGGYTAEFSILLV